MSTGSTAKTLLFWVLVLILGFALWRIIAKGVAGSHGIWGVPLLLLCQAVVYMFVRGTLCVACDLLRDGNTEANEG